MIPRHILLTTIITTVALIVGLSVAESFVVWPDPTIGLAARSGLSVVSLIGAFLSVAAVISVVGALCFAGAHTARWIRYTYTLVEDETGRVTVERVERFGVRRSTLAEFDAAAVTHVTVGHSPKFHRFVLWSGDPEVIPGVGFRNGHALRLIQFDTDDAERQDPRFRDALRSALEPRIASGQIVSTVDLKRFRSTAADATPVLSPTFA